MFPLQAFKFAVECTRSNIQPSKATYTQALEPASREVEEDRDYIHGKVMGSRISSICTSQTAYAATQE